MKVRVRIDGYVNVDVDEITEQQVEESICFQLGFGSMSIDNPVGVPEWDYADINVDL